MLLHPSIKGDRNKDGFLKGALAEGRKQKTFRRKRFWLHPPQRISKSTTQRNKTGNIMHNTYAHPKNMNNKTLNTPAHITKKTLKSRRKSEQLPTSVRSDLNTARFESKPQNLFESLWCLYYFFTLVLGARLRVRTATQRSKKGSEKVLERVLEKGSQKGFEKGVCYGFTARKSSKKGSQKAFLEGGFQKVPRTPPRRVRPIRRASYFRFFFFQSRDSIR